MDVIARLAALIEDELPVTSGMQAKDPKIKYTRLPKRLRPNKSRYKARATLMNTTNSDTKSPPVENSVGANSKYEWQSVAPFSRLIAELDLQLANPRTNERDKSTERIVKREVKTKRAVERNAKRARGAPEQKYPYNDPEKTRMMRRTTVTTSKYGMGF